MSAGRRTRRAFAVALAAVGVLAVGPALTGAASGPAASRAPATSGGGAGGGTLVIGKSFDLATLDPGRMFETTGGIIIPAMYDTLLTFENNDVTEPKPSLATSWEVNDDATQYTFTLRDDAVFSDGTPVTAADVAFSLNRVRELKGNGSFLMAGVTAEAQDDGTVVLTSEEPNPALPRILPTPTLGILNSKVVMANGGTDQPGADTADTAEAYLNSTSAGSGPYVLESFSTTSETVVARNDAYVGPTPANFDRIVLRNSDVTTQAIDVQNGNADIVMDLASDQLSSLRERRRPDDRRDGIADDLLPVRQRRRHRVRRDVEPRLRRGGAVWPRLRRPARSRRRRLRPSSGRDPRLVPRGPRCRSGGRSRRRPGQGRPRTAAAAPTPPSNSSTRATSP